MGRSRKIKSSLPERVYIRNGAYHYVDTSNKWHAIGRVNKATKKYPVVSVWEIHKWIEDFTQSETSPKVTISDIFNKFQAEHVPSLHKSTQNGYRARIKKLIRVFGDMHPNDLTKQHVYAYMDKRKAQSKAITANHEFSVLSSALTKAVRWGMVKENVCIGIQKFAIEREVRHVTDEEIETLCEAVSPMMRAAIYLFILTGRRLSELLSVKKTDILDEGIHFKLTKKKKTTYMIIEWSDELSSYVNLALKHHPHKSVKSLICTRKGNEYTPDGFSANFKRAIKRSGVKHFTIHDLRKKSSIEASTLVEAKERLGHTTDSVTRTHYRNNTSKSKPLR